MADNTNVNNNAAVVVVGRLAVPPGVSINTNGSGGYFQLRRKFIVARGIVGVF